MLIRNVLVCGLKFVCNFGQVATKLQLNCKSRLLQVQVSTTMRMYAHAQLAHARIKEA